MCPSLLWRIPNSSNKLCYLTCCTFINVTITRSNCQVFFAAGALVAVVQLGMLPRLLKVFGMTYLQRIGGVTGVLAFTLVPFATVLSWNDISVYVVSVAITFFVYCSMAVVRLLMAHMRYVLLYCCGCSCCSRRR